MDANFLNRFIALAIRLWIVSVLLLGCGEVQREPKPSSSKPFPIAPELASFYQKVGGEEILGALISPRLEEGSTVYQYTVNSLLLCERNSSSEAEVSFAPIGLDMNLPPYRSVLAAEGGGYSVNGIPIYPEFLTFYEKLGGGKRIGVPLSGLRYNPRLRRYEQFFEGVGMYRHENDPSGKVKLLAYGAWKCGEACFYPIPPQAEIFLPYPLDYRMAVLVDKLGADLSGFALSPVIKDSSGAEIVIFENIVVEIQPSSESKPKLLALPQKLGILPQAMVANQENDEQVFLSLDGDKGHHIRRSFMNYIDSHGGLELFGLPITEPMMGENGNIRQCFENLCLVEDRQLQGLYRIRPSPLGFEFATLFYGAQFGAGPEHGLQDAQPTRQSGTFDGSADQTPEITLEILEDRPFVDQQTAQEIGVIVHFGVQPAVNVQPTVILSFPNGETLEMELPPTNAQGKSYITIPPIQAPNGTLVDYRICLMTQSGVEVCARDDYLIWSSSE